MTLALFPYQITGAAFLRERPSALLFDAPGLGKTAQAIAAAAAGAPVLVGSPASVKGAWADEWRNWRGIEAQILSGRGSFRWPRPGEVLVVNNEILPPAPREIAELRVKIAEAEKPGDLLDLGLRPGDPVKLRQKLAAMEELRRSIDGVPPAPGTLAVLDECHCARSNKTTITKRWRWIFKEVRRRGGRAIGLSGTPLLNKPLELWSILTTFQLHKLAFPGGWWEFVRAFGGYKGAFGFEWGEPRDHLVAAALRRVALRRRYDDVATDVPPYLPPQRILVDVDAKTTARCDAALAWLAETGRNVESLVGMESIPFEEISRARAALALAKLPAAVAIVEEYEAAGEPLVVAGASVAPVQAIGSREGWAYITGDVPSDERTRIVADFQSGKIRHGVAISKAGSVGVTLHRAAHMLRIDRSFVPADNVQWPARLRRTGQTRPVMVRDLVANHVLDVRLDEILAVKERFVQAADAMSVGPEAASVR